jgi:hypothetical protein
MDRTGAYAVLDKFRLRFPELIPERPLQTDATYTGHNGDTSRERPEYRLS